MRTGIPGENKGCQVRMRNIREERGCQVRMGDLRENGDIMSDERVMIKEP